MKEIEKLKVFQKSIKGIFIKAVIAICLLLPFASYAQPNEVQDVAVIAQAAFGQVNDIWQSFTPTQDGRLVKITFDHGSYSTPNGTKTVNIYEGEGLSGTLLQTVSINVNNGSGTIATETITLSSPLQVQAGNLYTFAIENINPRTVQNTQPGAYADGMLFATFNGIPYTTFDLGFTTIMDVGTNVEISSRDEISTTNPFYFDITFYGTPTNLELSDFSVTNGTASALNVVSGNNYELAVTTTGDATVTVDFVQGSALIDGLDNDGASASVEVDLAPFQSPDLILTDNRLVVTNSQLFLNNLGINTDVYIAPIGTSDFTTGSTITQGTTFLVQDDPGCIPQAATTCGIDPLTGNPDPPGCIEMPEVICTSTHQPVIYAPATPGEYKLFLTDGSGNATAVSTTSIFVTSETVATTVAVAVDDTNLLPGEASNVTFLFLGAVTDFTNADLTVPNGTLTDVSSSDGNRTFTATFTPNSDVVASTNVITVDQTAITDGTNPGTGSTNSNNFAIDTGIPKVASIQCTSGCEDIYGTTSADKTISIDVNFDRDVILSGTLELELDFEIVNRTVIVTQEAGTQNFTADYEFIANDRTSDLDYASVSALSLRTGSTLIGTSNSVATDLALVAPGAVGSISENRDIYVDMLPLAINNIRLNDPTEEITKADQVTFRVTFNKAMDNSSFGANDFDLTGTAAGDGTIGTGVMVDAMTYDYTVSGIENSNGTLGLSYAGELLDHITNNPMVYSVPPTNENYTLVNNLLSFDSSPTTSISQNDGYSYSIEVSSNLGDAGLDVSAAGLPSWLTLIQGNIISTIAGTGTNGTQGAGGPATAADLSPFLRDVEYDHLGNLYIIQRNKHTIRKVDTNGDISVFAGTGSEGFSGDDGQAIDATFNYPSSIAFDATGNAYVSDDLNHRIRKIATDGIITTVAGTGVSGFSGDDGDATAAQLSAPRGVAIGSDGNLYIAEELRIRMVDFSTGKITTAAGNGTGTFADNVEATSSGFLMNAIAIDAYGHIYIASQEHAIRKIDASTGLTSTIAGTGTMGFSGDDGIATSAQLNNPNAIAVDKAGTIFIGERENDRIRKITMNGIISTIAGNGNLGYSGDGENATAAMILNPEGLAIGPNGQVVFSDAGNLRIRSIQTNRATLVGIPNQDGVGSNEITLTVTNGSESADQLFTIEVANVNDEPGLSRIANSSTLATEDESYDYQVYADDIDGNFVALEVTTIPDWMSSIETIQTFTFTSEINASDLAYSDGFFYITDQSNNSIYKVDNLGGSLTRVAGQTDNAAGFVDANGTSAAFETPFAIDVDSNGDLYVIDQDNHALRKITDLDGDITVTTIAGNGIAGNESGPADKFTATFDTPTNLLIAPNDDIYIADAGNGVIKLYSEGNITTLQDDAGVDFTFTLPYGLALDGSGVLYVTDFDGHTIYSIDGTTRTLLAGTAGTLGTTDGAGGTALFDNPSGLVTNTNGSVLIVAESGNGSIRRLDVDGGNVSVTTLSDALNTPLGMMSNPRNGALLIADLGFSSITENYHAIKFSGTPTNDQLGLNEAILELNDETTTLNETLSFYVSNTNDAPTYNGLTQITVTEGDQVNYSLSAEDIDDDAISVTATTLPSWLTLETPESVVSTVAGNGVSEYSGDDGVATAAGIGTPDALAIDIHGNLFIAHDNYIRKVNTSGVITTIAGDETSANVGSHVEATNAQISNVVDMHFGPHGNLYISVSGAIRKIAPDGIISTIAGAVGNTGSAGTGDGAAAVSATFNQNSGIFVDTDGILYVADQADEVVRKIDNDGVISTVATGVTFPFDIVVDRENNIYAVNDGSTGLLKIDASDVKTDLTSASDIHFSTQDIAIDNLGNIYGVTNFSPANQVKVYNISSGEVKIMANDTDTQGFSGDGGVASSAAFNKLEAIAVGPNGHVYLADGDNGRIRKLSIQEPVLSGTPTQDEVGNHNIDIDISDGIANESGLIALTVNNLPEIINVTATDGVYKEGDEIEIIVTFDGEVEVTGSGNKPSLALETGTTDQTAQWSATSGSDMTFTYTVQDGDVSADLAYTSTSIAMGDYTIQSSQGVTAVLTLPEAGATGSLSFNQDIVVDNLPEITNVTSTDGTYTEGDEIEIIVTFDGNIEVTGSGTKPSLVLETGTTDQTAQWSATSGNDLTFTYTVQDGDVSADLAYTSTSIAIGDYMIQSSQGVTAVLTLPEAGATGSLSFNQDIVVDNLPEITNVTSTDGVYKEGDEIEIIVTFDGEVEVTGSGTKPSLVLETGTTDQTAQWSETSGNDLIFTYTVQDGDVSADLAYTSTSIAIGDYTIQSPQGIDAALTLPVAGATGSLSFNQDVIIEIIEVTGIASGLISEMKVYPNPTSDWVNLEIDNHVAINRMALYSINGHQLLNEVVLNNKVRLNVESLNRGIYTLIFYGENGLIKQAKISVR